MVRLVVLKNDEAFNGKIEQVSIPVLLFRHVGLLLVWEVNQEALFVVCRASGFWKD